MSDVEAYRFADDGRFPNSALPVLVYRQALPPDPAAMERVFAAHDWSNGWRDGIFDYRHFHSTAHEVLGIAAGAVRVAFGGPSGQEVTVRAGDVVAIPAGVAHRNMGQSADLLVVGAYPGGSGYDIRRGDPAEHAAAVRAIAAVPLPKSDPVLGHDGGLRRRWRTAGEPGSGSRTAADVRTSPRHPSRPPRPQARDTALEDRLHRHRRQRHREHGAQQALGGVDSGVSADHDAGHGADQQ